MKPVSSPALIFREAFIERRLTIGMVELGPVILKKVNIRKEVGYCRADYE